MPENVSTACDYTRSYHFWLSAYLLERLVAEGSQANSAGKAVYLGDLAYESTNGLGTKDYLFNFDNEAYRIETQKNIALTDAGIQWAKGHKNVSPDQFLDNLILTSQMFDTNNPYASTKTDGPLDKFDYALNLNRWLAYMGVKNN